MLNPKKIREDFPILNRKLHGDKKLVYLDNAATSQKPKEVIETIKSYYENYNANVHRGLHTLSQESSKEYEQAHAKVANFIGAKENEIVFTKNTTESINLVAYSLEKNYFQKGDEIILTKMEHHSNLVPWQELAKKIGIKLKFIDVTLDGKLDLESLDYIINSRTKLISITHCSNVLGTITPVKEIGKRAKEIDALFMLDACQSVPRFPVNVKELDCDILAFSGHKMLGPTGIGALYAKENLLNAMEPFISGGGMISEVFLDHSTWNNIPWKFEGGTPNIAGGIGLGVAIDYLQKIGMENILEHEINLTQYATEKLKEIDGVKLYGPEKDKVGIISFTVNGIHPHDVSQILDLDGVAVRAGHHCAQPLHTHLGIKNTTRASFYFYNTKEEIDIFVESLKKTVNTMK